MSREPEEDLDTDSSDEEVDVINAHLLELIGETVKLSVMIAELDKKRARGVARRWNAFVSTVNSVELPEPPKVSHDA